MEGWKIWALLGLIVGVLVFAAWMSTLIYPMPKEDRTLNEPTPPTSGGPLDLYTRGGGNNPRAMAILTEAQRVHDERRGERPELDNEEPHAHVEGNDEAAVLRMLSSATFGPNAGLVLPSGTRLNTDEARVFTAMYRNNEELDRG